MSENAKSVLTRVVFTLEQINVRGRENMDHLLGAILAIESVINEAEKEEVDSDG